MIVVDCLTKSYGDVRAVENLSFVAKPGYVTGFLGPNGAGKSTTLNVLAGLHRPDTGRVTILGKSYFDFSHPLRDVGIMLNSEDLPADSSGETFLRWICRANGIDPASISGILELVGLANSADRRIGALSLGMRQRLGIAAALIGEPSVIVLDEPLNGLDPAGIIWLRGLLRELADAGKTVLLSSHQLEEIAHVADWLVVINQGKLCAQGSCSDLTSSLLTETTVVNSLDNDRLAAVLQHLGHAVTQHDDGLAITNISTRNIGQLAIKESIVLTYLNTASVSLEEVFVALTADPEAELATQYNQLEDD